MICLSVKIPLNLCTSFSRTSSDLCIYHLVVWSNFNFLHNSQWITFPNKSCYSFESFSHQRELIVFHWSLSDSKSQYSCWSQQRCSLDSLHSSSYFQVLKSLYQPFRDCTECPNYNWYHRHFVVLLLLLPLLVFVTIKAGDFTEVWVTTCLLGSPGLFQVFLPILYWGLCSLNLYPDLLFLKSFFPGSFLNFFKSSCYY